MNSVLAPATAPDVVIDPLVRCAPIHLPCQIHDADLWFADDPAGLEAAKALCGDCPARLGCLLGALHRREPAGVWGGQIFDGGAILRVKRPRGRPRKHPRDPACSGAGSPEVLLGLQERLDRCFREES